MVNANLHSPFPKWVLGWALASQGPYSPVDGGQFGRLPADGELRTVEVGLGPGLVEREASIAVTFELCPEQRAQGGRGQLRHGWGQRENSPEGWQVLFLRLMTYFQEGK